MSDELFEVAFSGEILAGEDAADVKARVGKIFNADETKLAHLFSGKTIVIKKNINQQTAAKYKAALNKAGAECIVRSMNPVQPVTPSANTAEQSTPADAAAASDPVATPVDYGDVPPPPQTDPLGITADQIADLSVSIAPLGSDLQDDIKQPDVPQIDTSGFEVAPVGSTIDISKKEPDPPPPDTSGLSMAD